MRRGRPAEAKPAAEEKPAERPRAAAPTAADVIEAMGDGLIVTDLDGNIVSMNRAVKDFLAKVGSDTKEFIGRSIIDLPTTRPEDAEKVVGLTKEVIEKGRAGPLEVLAVTGDWFSFTVSLLKDDEGNPNALIAVVRDITELKRISEKGRAELEHAYMELAVLKRARAFAFVLFKDVFEPILRECGRRTIGKIRDQVMDLSKRLPLAKGVRVGYDGSVTLDEVSIAETLAGMSHEEATDAVTSTFSELMDVCDPPIRADLGDERAAETVSTAFSGILEKPELVTYKSDLMRVVPDGVEVPRGYILLEVGRSYLVEERRPTHASRIFSEMVSHGFPGLCISTTHPTDMKREHGLEKGATVLWLSKAEKDYSISPSSLGMLRDRIASFAERNENSVVLLDGLEYLITTNGFDLTLKFLHDLKEMVTLNRSRLIVTVSPATLGVRELALLERSTEPIEVVEEEE